MNETSAVWIAVASILILLSFARPVFAVCFYMQTFFAMPALWWWGKTGPLGAYRWNLFAGIVMVVSVVLDRMRNGNDFFDDRLKLVGKVAIFALLNATFVHVVLATDPANSVRSYSLLAKFTLLYFMIIWSIRTPVDMKIFLLAIGLGLGYEGFEVSINKRGHIVHSRLEGVGAPGATNSNQLACMLITALPMFGGLLFYGKTREKAAVVLCAPLALNVILLCNSRAAFLSLAAAAGVLVVFSKGRARMWAISALCLGCVAGWTLLGDARIIERFWTTFNEKEERDSSAAGRLAYWAAGLEMVRDYPLGAGGYAFKETHGYRYTANLPVQYNIKSVHQGYINEACEWGVQGLALRLAWLGLGCWVAYQTVKFRALLGDTHKAFFAACLIAAQVSFLVSCLFGDFLESEWGIWVAAASVAFARLYGPYAEEIIDAPFDPYEHEHYEAEHYPPVPQPV